MLFNTHLSFPKGRSLNDNIDKCLTSQSLFTEMFSQAFVHGKSPGVSCDSNPLTTWDIHVCHHHKGSMEQAQELSPLYTWWVPVVNYSSHSTSAAGIGNNPDRRVQSGWHGSGGIMKAHGPAFLAHPAKQLYVQVFQGN